MNISTGSDSLETGQDGLLTLWYNQQALSDGLMETEVGKETDNQILPVISRQTRKEPKK